MLVVLSTENKIQTIEDINANDYDCILILGAGVWANNQPSPMLQDRLDQGIQAYWSGFSKALLMSGDHGRIDYDEVNVMKDVAIAKGIDSSAVFMDHAGFSTYESLYRAKFIFQVKKVLIVSQKEHLYRALYIADALGLDATGLAAEEINYGGALMRTLRESLARVKDVFTMLIQPKPTYLGTIIPIDSNGDLTNDR
jgi:vancomycin permeability regulator SanA